MTLWVNVPCPDEKLVPSVAKSKFGLVVLYLHVSILVGGYGESCRGGGSRKYCSVDRINYSNNWRNYIGSEISCNLVVDVVNIGTYSEPSILYATYSFSLKRLNN